MKAQIALGLTMIAPFASASILSVDVGAQVTGTAYVSGLFTDLARLDQRFSVWNNGTLVQNYNNVVYTGILGVNVGHDGGASERVNMLCVELPRPLGNAPYLYTDTRGLVGFLASQIPVVSAVSDPILRSQMSAALAIAAWEMSYDFQVYQSGAPSFNSATWHQTGNFRYNLASVDGGAIFAQATQYLVAARVTDYRYYQSNPGAPGTDDYQDFVAYQAIPGPAAALSFALGFLGRRRRGANREA
jgi:predicted outer membrane repeat protein